MNFKDMEYFYYLCKFKNFTKAAKHLYVSQPSISIALRRLEKELNTHLILRDHSEKQLSLTQTGVILEKHVENILQEIKEIKSEISKINGAKIKLGVPPIIGAYYFPVFMKDLIKNGLADHIDLVETGSVKMKSLLLSGEIDIALIGSLNPLNDNNIDAYILKTDKFNVCMSKNHVLSSKKKIDFHDLLDEQFVVLGDSYIHSKVLKKLCIKNGMPSKSFYHTDEIQTAKSLIASGFGIGIMINMAVRSMKSIKTIPLTESINFYISLASKKGHFMTPTEKKIRDIMLSHNS